MGFFNRRNKDKGGQLMSLRQSLVPKNPPDGAPCNYESTIRSGFFIRAFECDTLERKLRKDARRVNMSFIKSAVPTGTFVKEFRQCALQQLTRRGAATSLLRHDLPTRSYRDTFGFMLRTNASQVSCAYAFDSHRTYGTGLRCAKTVGGSIEQHLARRYQVVTQACSRKGHKRTSGVNAQAEDWRVNCCWDNVEDAAEAQRRYVELPHKSMCSIGDGLNQMQLSWEVDDVVGVYYVRRVDEEFAKLIWSLVTDVKKSRAETRLGEGASAALPKLDYCRLPPPKLKLRKAQPGEEQRLAELAASAPPAMGMLSSWLSFLG